MTAGNAGPVRFIVEESQHLGSARGEEIAAVLKEGRRHGLAVRTTTQRPVPSP